MDGIKLGDISPLYGALEGEGFYGKMLNPGLTSQLVNEEEEKKKPKARGYKKGGVVKCRGNGVAQRGKTRGRFV